MCGRFTLKTSRAKIAELIGSSKSLPLFEPRYNIAPSQPVLAVRIEPKQGLQGTSPVPATYLREPCLDASGRKEYRRRLRAILA